MERLCHELRPGDVLLVYRERRQGLPRAMLGQAVILTVESETSTAKMMSSARESVVGDWVAVDSGAAEEPLVIRELLARRTRLSRRAAGNRTEEQVVAANVDRVAVVMGLDGDYSPRRLERYLAMIDDSGALPAVTG